MPAADVYRTTVFYRINSRHTINVLHFQQQNTVVGEDEYAALDDHFNTNLAGPLKACLSNETNILGLRVKKIYSGQAQPTDFNTISGAGTVVSAALPPNIVAVGRLYADQHFPHRHGRTFISGIPKTFNSGSQLTVTAGGIIATYLAALATVGNGGAHTTQFRGVVWSDSVGVSHDIAFTEVVAALITRRQRERD